MNDDRLILVGVFRVDHKICKPLPLKKQSAANSQISQLSKRNWTGRLINPLAVKSHQYKV